MYAQNGRIYRILDRGRNDCGAVYREYPDQYTSDTFFAAVRVQSFFVLIPLIVQVVFSAHFRNMSITKRQVIFR